MATFLAKQMISNKTSALTKSASSNNSGGGGSDNSENAMEHEEFLKQQEEERMARYVDREKKREKIRDKIRNKYNLEKRDYLSIVDLEATAPKKDSSKSNFSSRMDNYSNEGCFRRMLRCCCPCCCRR
ncbi:complexin [Trichoplax adhaerens]|uniref:Complexin n=1 Tax=Trichoplax adhaerens TaxID=10228 RepID=B3S8V8_TRIAD|nr:complexin [Trichoplax adhaerens]EDV20839.1 complexin [Trichoplax adhaerens]|eukprot:XP_002116780.1 complexin [Trichoplax adhaerens]